jgi:uncharacterized membrane protein
MSRGRPYRGAAMLVTLLTNATPCFADLIFCNKSDAKIEVSIGHFQPRQGWTSQGWWPLEEGVCRTIVHGQPSRIYYVFAIDERGGSWSAPPDQRGGWFCISSAKYAFHNRDYEDSNKTLHCEKAKQFRVLDTGNVTNYTLNFNAGQGDPTSSHAPAEPVSPSPSPSPSPTGAGTACQRFPNLC